MRDQVLLFELRERTSVAGNRYLSGWLGKASVVAFLDHDAKAPTWQVFVSTPQSKGETPPAQQSPFTPRQQGALDGCPTTGALPDSGIIDFADGCLSPSPTR